MESLCKKHLHVFSGDIKGGVECSCGLEKIEGKFSLLEYFSTRLVRAKQIEINKSLIKLVKEKDFTDRSA